MNRKQRRAKQKKAKRPVRKSDLRIRQNVQRLIRLRMEAGESRIDAIRNLLEDLEG